MESAEYFNDNYVITLLKSRLSSKYEDICKDNIKGLFHKWEKSMKTGVQHVDKGQWIKFQIPSSSGI